MVIQLAAPRGKALSVLGLLIVLGTRGASAAPERILYHGRLTSATGVTLNSPVQCRIRILRGGEAVGYPSSGTVVYEETARVAPSADGLVTVWVGAGAPSSTCPEGICRLTERAFKDGGQRFWLEIVRDDDGVPGSIDDEPFLPRTPVASGGYALRTQGGVDPMTPDRPLPSEAPSADLPRPPPADSERTSSVGTAEGGGTAARIGPAPVHTPEPFPGAPIPAPDLEVDANIKLTDFHGMLWPTSYGRCIGPSCDEPTQIESHMVFGQRSDTHFGQRDNVFLWAYNYDLTDGMRFNPSEAMFKDQIETSYWDGGLQTQFIERNWDFMSADGVSFWRPFAFQIGTGGPGATWMLNRADWLFRTCESCTTMRLNAKGDTVSIGTFASDPMYKLLVGQSVVTPWFSQNGIMGRVTLALDDISATNFEYVGSEGGVEMGSFASSNEIASTIGTRGYVEIDGTSVGSRKVRNYAAGVEGRCWIAGTDATLVDAPCIGGLFQASAHGAGSNLRAPILYAAYLKSPLPLGPGAIVGNGGGLFIENMMGYGSGGRQGAIYVMPQSASQGHAGQNGNIRMEGGEWNNGHLQLDQGHLWWDAAGARLRAKGSEPAGSTDGAAVVVGTGSTSHGILLWGDARDPAYQTGASVCGSSGLSCVSVRTLTGLESDCTLVQSDDVFYALCR